VTVARVFPSGSFDIDLPIPKRLKAPLLGVLIWNIFFGSL
jgi:hypothetical protein